MIDNSIFTKLNNLNNSYNHINDEFSKNQNLTKLDEKGLTDLCLEVLKTSVEINEALKNPELDDNSVKKYQKAVETCVELKKKANDLLSVAHKIILMNPGKEEVNIASRPPSIQGFTATEKTLEPKMMEKLGDKLTPSFLQKKINKSYGYLFAGYGQNEKAKYQKEKLKNLRSKETELAKKIDNEKIKLTTVNKKIADDGENKELIDQKVQIEQNLTNLGVEEKNLLHEIIETKKAVQKTDDLAAKGERTRTLLTSLGGERVTLKTIDGVKIDGTYLSADKFKKELKLHGGQMMTFKRTFMDGKSQQFEAIAFDAEEYKKNDTHVLKVLNELNCLTEITKEGAIDPGFGWVMVQDDPHILLVKDEFFLKNIYHGKPENFLFETWDTCEITTRPDGDGSITERVFKPIDTDKKSQGGSVIISSGNAGVYEMHKAEALAFMSRGMNVMLFNFRGYGLSEGTPSKNGLHRDIQAAYEWVKKVTGHTDSQILFKALCMSGGAAAFMAAQHPETNIFLDQTYSSMKDLAKEQVQAYVDNYIQDELNKLPPEQHQALKIRLMQWAAKNSKTLIQGIAGGLIPQFEVAENLAKNHGKKAIFYVHNDILTTKDHVERNMKQLSKDGKLDEVSVFSAPGEHSASWITILSSPAEMTGTGLKIRNIESKTIEDTKELEKRNIEQIDIIIQEVETMRRKADDLENEILDLDTPEKRKIAAEKLIEESNQIENYVNNKVTQLFNEAKEHRNSKDLDRANQLEQLASDVTVETLEKISALREEAESLQSMEEDPFLKKRMIIQNLRDDADALYEKGNQHSDNVMKEIEELQKTSKKKIDLLRESLDPSEFKSSFVARAQMDHFLKKAKLADNVLN